MQASEAMMGVEVIPVDTLPPGGALAVAWDEQVAKARNLYVMYQARDFIVCSRDGAQRPIEVLISNPTNVDEGIIAPLGFQAVPLRFQATRRLGFSLAFDCVEVLGGQPLGKLSHAACVELLDTLWRKYPRIQGVYFKSVPDDSELWRILSEHQWRIGRTPVHKLDGERTFHYLALPPTFDGYLGEFRKKQRYNLKRQVRVLSEAFDEALEVKCITLPEDVPALIAEVRKVAEKSWKAEELERALPEIVTKPEALTAIAAQGLLRAYVLKVKNEPCAYAVGYLFKNSYHYSDIGYDSTLSQYSPGNVLLLLVIQDLIEKAGAQFMNFGITDAGYKRIFGNRHIKDAALLVLRPGVRNAVLLKLHGTFQRIKDFARDRLRAGRDRAQAEDEAK
jgi:hypothetical protein